MLRKFSILIALVTCFINVLLAGLHRGYYLGSSETIGFRIIGDAYELLAGCYTYICVFLFVFFVGKLVKKKVISQIICLTSLILIIFPYWTLYLQKSFFFSDPDTITSVLREAILLDLISFSLVLILLVIQIITAFQNYFEWKHRNTRIE